MVTYISKKTKQVISSAVTQYFDLYSKAVGANDNERVENENNTETEESEQ